MGFLDSLFSPGQIEEQGKVESQTNFPQWYNRLNQANLLRAAETAFEPYQAYQGPRQALSDPDQIAARQGIIDTSGIASPFFTEAFNQSKLGSTQLAGTDIRPYMSPFQQAVTDIALRETRRQGDIQRNQLDSQATKAGAFGGSRAALQQAEAERNIQQNLADIQATGSQQAYNSALAQLGFDRDAAARAAPQMGVLGTGLQTVTTSGLKEAELAAERNRAERQGALDIAYQDFLTQRQYPMAQASGLQSLLTGATVPGSSLTTTFGQPPSVGGQIAGAALAGLGALGSGGAFEPGGFVNNIFGYKGGGEIKRERGYANGTEVEELGTGANLYPDEARAMAEAAVLQEAMTEDLNYVTGDSPVEEALNYILRAVQLTSPQGLGTVIANEFGPGIAKVFDDATTKPRYYLDRGESGGPSSDPDAGMTPLLAAAMAGDPEDSVVDPTSDPVTSDPDTDTSDSGSGGFDYDLLLELGLGMMAAGAVPGSTLAGSLGQGGLSALQARREADALRRKEDLENRKLEAIIKANDQDFRAVFASLDQDQRQEVIDFMANRQSDLLEALSDSTFVGPDRDVAQQEYDDVTSTLDNLFYPDDVPIMNANLNE
jgi:hypothetical protein